MAKQPSPTEREPLPAAEAAEPPAPDAERQVGRLAASSPRHSKATTREGKRAVTAYIDPAAFRQLKHIAADEDAQMQDLVTEAINLLFEKRGLSRLA